MGSEECIKCTQNVTTVTHLVILFVKTISELQETRAGLKIFHGFNFSVNVKR